MCVHMRLCTRTHSHLHIISGKTHSSPKPTLAYSQSCTHVYTSLSTTVGSSLFLSGFFSFLFLAAAAAAPCEEEREGLRERVVGRESVWVRVCERARAFHQLSAPVMTIILTHPQTNTLLLRHAVTVNTYT